MSASKLTRAQLVAELEKCAAMNAELVKRDEEWDEMCEGILARGEVASQLGEQALTVGLETCEKLRKALTTIQDAISPWSVREEANGMFAEILYIAKEALE